MHEIKGLYLTYIFKYQYENLVGGNIINRIALSPLRLLYAFISIMYRTAIDYVLIKTSDLFLTFPSTTI